MKGINLSIMQKEKKGEVVNVKREKGRGKKEEGKRWRRV
jgi:hypothetical protein